MCKIVDCCGGRPDLPTLNILHIEPLIIFSPHIMTRCCPLRDSTLAECPAKKKERAGCLSNRPKTQYVKNVGFFLFEWQSPLAAAVIMTGSKEEVMWRCWRVGRKVNKTQETLFFFISHFLLTVDVVFFYKHDHNRSITLTACFYFNQNSTEDSGFQKLERKWGMIFRKK